MSSHFQAEMTGSGSLSNAIDRLDKDIPMIEKELKRNFLTKTPLTLDQRLLFLKLKTTSFGRRNVDGTKSVSCKNECFCESIQVLIHFVRPSY